MKTAYCFDLDGTVTSVEILPILAREVGYYDEISALTEATIKGLIPFESSFKLRCKILADIPVSRVQDIVREVPVFQETARFLSQRSADCYVVTGNLEVWIAPLIERLGVNLFSSTSIVENDRLIRINSVLEKGDAVETLRNRYDRIVAVGDGMGDVSMFEKSDVRIAFGGVHLPIESLVEVSDYVCFSEQALCNTLNTL